MDQELAEGGIRGNLENIYYFSLYFVSILWAMDF